MKLSQFRFDLPLNLIAQNPTKKREESRMMVIHRKTGQMENRHFKDIMEYFEDKDVFVVNNTKVFPARMYGRKEKTGAKIEVFLLRELNKANKLWDVIVDPARKIRVGNKLYFGDSDELVAEVIDNTTSRGRTIRRSRPVVAPRISSRYTLRSHLEQDFSSLVVTRNEDPGPRQRLRLGGGWGDGHGNSPSCRTANRRLDMNARRASLTPPPSRP